MCLIYHGKYRWLGLELPPMCRNLMHRQLPSGLLEPEIFPRLDPANRNVYFGAKVSAKILEKKFPELKSYLISCEQPKCSPSKSYGEKVAAKRQFLTKSHFWPKFITKVPFN